MPPSLLLRVLEDVYRRIERLGASPVVAGGLAVSFWGHPRSTQDIDLAVLVSDFSRFQSELQQIGMKATHPNRLVDLGFVQVSQWTQAIEEEYIDCEIDFLISNSNYHRVAIERARRSVFPGVQEELRVLTCEDLLLFKAASGRLIDLADIKTLYEMHRHSLDQRYLESKTEELRLPAQFWLQV